MSDIFLGFQNQVASHYETKVFWYVAIPLVEYGTLTYTNYSVDQIPSLLILAQVDYGSDYVRWLEDAFVALYNSAAWVVSLWKKKC